jgi:hypothetical protein
VYFKVGSTPNSVDKALIKHPGAVDGRLRTDGGPRYESETFRESKL